jgi:hypothetical protein
VVAAQTGETTTAEAIKADAAKVHLFTDLPPGVLPFESNGAQMRLHQENEAASGLSSRSRRPPWEKGRFDTKLRREFRLSHIRYHSRS